MTPQDTRSRSQNNPTQEPQHPRQPTQQPLNETFKRFTRRSADAGLATIMIVIGAVLFVFPEPVTSVAGVLLVLGGVATWLLDRWGSR